ncbi:MAG TPA: DUF3108 domain-containing protein [Chthoniobacterales bacterium]
MSHLSIALPEAQRPPVATAQPRAELRPVGFGRTIAILLGLGFLPLTVLGAAAPDWEKTVTTLPRGNFPNPRPLVATYNFGWNEVVAANAEIRFDKSGDQLQLQAAGGTVGVVRALWRFDTHYRALADATTLRPISMHQVDELRSKTVTTDITFKRDSLERVRTDTKANKTPKPKNFSFAGGVFDMHSALLYLRSQALHEGDVYRVVVYPATSPYLVTLTVTGREPITIAAGSYPAIKLDVQLHKIGKKNELEPHRKFRRASVWISDDSDRLLLRIEASIFVGKVFTELQSVRFPSSPH